jgi:hypothetical protein
MMKNEPASAPKIEVTCTRLSQHEMTIARGCCPSVARWRNHALFSARLVARQPWNRWTDRRTAGGRGASRGPSVAAGAKAGSPDNSSGFFAPPQPILQPASGRLGLG